MLSTLETLQLLYPDKYTELQEKIDLASHTDCSFRSIRVRSEFKEAVREIAERHSLKCRILGPYLYLPEDGSNVKEYIIAFFPARTKDVTEYPIALNGSAWKNYPE